MARNMIDSNTAVFKKVDLFASNKSATLKNAQKPRFITCEKYDFHVASTLEHEATEILSNNKFITLFKSNDTFYLILVGFSHVDLTTQLSSFFEIDITSNLLIAVLADTPITPKATVDELIDVIDIGYRHDEDGYQGHHLTQMLKIYPSIQVFQHDDYPPKDFIFHVMCICLDEHVNRNSWITKNLAEAIQLFGPQDIPEIPYHTITRSIYDQDPGSLFLSLYRCLEGLYALKHCTRIIKELELNKNWTDLAIILENELKWRPPEQSSLEALFQHGSSVDFTDIFEAMNSEVPTEKLPEKAAKKIYKLRNSLVHFRPIHQSDEHKEIDWEKLCIAMVGCITHIYSEIQ